MKNVVTHEENQEARALVREHGSIRAAARASGIPYATLHGRLNTSDGEQKTAQEPVVHGRIHSTPRTVWPLPAKGKIARYIFTCAQNNTRLHPQVWANLQVLAEHLKARICVSTFTYKKESYGKKSVKRGQQATAEDKADLWYAPEIEPFVLDESVEVAPGLIWCGEMNILPTASRPLRGFEAYTGVASGIFPHVKIAMDSVATGISRPAKFNYTTGTVTQRNYIAKTAGLRAEFHHSYGGLLVEVDSEGRWFCRQLNADTRGVLHDLNVRVKDGQIEMDQRVEAITWGDIHVGTVSKPPSSPCWGSTGLCAYLAPKYQFLHDVLDFESANHHDAKNPHARFRKFMSGKDDVVAEMQQVAHFLEVLRNNFPGTRSVVVNSNHDNRLMRWLQEADYRTDPRNALFFLRCQLRVYQLLEQGKQGINIVADALAYLNVPKEIRFLDEDESFVICRDAHGGIECGMHGHSGVDGGPGSLNSYARMGRKSNTGHTHRAGIVDGAYSAGVTGALKQGYNKGPSTWSHSHIVTYPNGKRAIITVREGKWRA